MEERNLQKFVADLHVHTALSPCADSSCTPPNIVAAAVERGLDMIAITDHNSAANVEAMARCGARHGLRIIPGMEVTTREDVHVVCLLGSAEAALALQEIAFSALPDESNRPDFFGPQLLMDADGNTVGECNRLLAGSTRLALEEVVSHVHTLGGLAIAAHVDRPSFSVIANLGWVPPDAGFDALEISAALGRDEALARFSGLDAFPLVTGSDAHLPSNVGDGPTLFLLASRSLEEIRGAFQRLDGREHLIL